MVGMSKMAAQWFLPKNRIVVMASMLMVLMGSTVFGSFIPNWVFGDYSFKDDPGIHQKGREHVITLFKVVAIIIFSFSIPVLLL